MPELPDVEVMRRYLLARGWSDAALLALLFFGTKLSKGPRWKTLSWVSLNGA